MLFLKNPLLRFLAPPACPVCRQEVPRRNGSLCRPCAATLHAFSLKPDLRCSRCYHPLRSGRCDFCSSRAVFFDEHRSLFSLNPGWRKILHRWKYQHERGLYEAFLPAVRELLDGSPLLDGVDRLVYIDSGREGKRMRSFQPCRDLVVALVLERKLAGNGDLVKTGNRQSANSRFHRHIRIQRSMRMSKRVAEIYRNTRPGVLLLEDVFTTGATANEAARILKKNGAKFVRVISLLFREDLI